MTRTGARALAVVAGAHLLSGCVVAAGSRGNGSGSSFFFLLLPLALMMLLAGRARRRHRPTRGPSRSFSEQHETTNEQVLRAELSVLADDVIRLEPQVALNEQARDDYEAATHRYRVAQAALDYAKEDLDLVRVQRVVDEANGRCPELVRSCRVAPRRSPAPLQRPGPR
jgi:hypothetical protein